MSFFNKALACPLCGLHRWIKTSFHLSFFFLFSLSPSLYINLPSTNSVSSSAMRHTVICECVCVCARIVQWETGCPFGRQQYTEAPLRKTGLLLNHWQTLSSHCAALSLSLSLFYTHFQICSQKHSGTQTDNICTHIDTPLQINSVKVLQGSWGV